MSARDFNPSGELVARKTFKCGSRQYAPGMPFPWKILSISERKARKLFEAGHICHPGLFDAPVSVPHTPPSLVTKTSLPEPTPDPEPEPVPDLVKVLDGDDEEDEEDDD